VAEGWYFIDPNSNSYRIDDLTANRVLEAIGGMGMPPVKNLKTVAPQQHGETFRGFRLKPRVINLAYVVKGASEAALYNDHQTWLAAMKPFDTAAKFRREMADGSQYEIDVRYNSGLLLDTKDRIGVAAERYGVQLIAFDPVWRKLPLQSKTFTVTGFDLVLPFVLPQTLPSSLLNITDTVTLAGTWRAYPVITLTGPMTNPKVTNLTTNQKIEISVGGVVIGLGETVTIDLSPGVKTVKKNDGTDLYSKLTTDSDIFGFYLKDPTEVSGGENQISVYASACTSASGVKVEWYHRFIGI
jgi:hypothetical protein